MSFLKDWSKFARGCLIFPKLLIVKEAANLKTQSKTSISKLRAISKLLKMKIQKKEIKKQPRD
jgi:hypothetical protein